jgi:hypothetical protein
MDNEPKFAFSDYALRRMQLRGISESHVWYCIVHHDNDEEYCVGGKELVWKCKLPDGRNIKIRVRDGSANPLYIIDAFSFK